MKKKCISMLILLLFILNLSSCKEANTTTVIPNTYIEEDLGTILGLKSPMNIVIASDGTQYIVNKENENEYTLLDSKGTKIWGFISDTYRNVAASDTRDNLYFLFQGDEEDSEGKIDFNLKIYNVKNGTEKEIKLGKLSVSTDKFITSMAVGISGDIVLAKYGESFIVKNKDSGNIIEIELPGCRYVDLDSKNNIIVCGNNLGNKPFLRSYNLTGDKVLWEYKGETPGDFKYTRYDKWDNSIFVLDDKGIGKYSAEGKFLGYIMGTGGYKIKGLNTFMCKMEVDSENRIYFIIRDTTDSTNTSKLYRYMTSVNAAGRSAEAHIKELKIMVPYKSNYIGSAINEFERQYPDIKINITDFNTTKQTTGSQEKARVEKAMDDFVNKVNTEILAGKCPDIVSVANIPYRKYIDKGAFVDLSELISQDGTFDLNEYYSNVFEALKYNGSLYTMPTFITLGKLFAGKTLLDGLKIQISDKNWAWDDFYKVAEELKQSNVFLLNANPFDHMLVIDEYVDTKNKRAYFDSEKFIKLLNLSKAFIDNGFIAQKSDFSNLSYMLSNKSLCFCDIPLRSYYEVKFFEWSVLHDKMYILDFPDTNVNGAVFSAADLFAMSKNSRYKNEAWMFLKFLLSENIQQSVFNEQDGFPINKNALDYIAQRRMEVYGIGSERLKPEQQKIGPMTQNDIDMINNFISTLNRYEYIDPAVEKIVKEETNGFFAGEKSAESTAEIIQSKVEIMLEE